MARLRSNSPIAIHRTEQRKLLKDLCLSFTSQNKYNNFLFNIYFKHRINKTALDYRYVEPSICLLKYLQSYTVSEIKNWFDVYELSFTAKIGPHFNRKECPIVYLGHILEKENHIIYREKSYPIFLCLQTFAPESREVIKRYFFNYLKKSHHIDTALYWLKIIQDYGKTINGDLSTATTENIQHYLKTQSQTLPTNELKKHRNVLNKLICFLQNESSLALSHLEKINSQLFYQPCIRCQKSKFCSDYDRKCILCINDDILFGFISSMKTKISSQKIYNQYIFDCYLIYIKRYRVTHNAWAESKVFVHLLNEYDFVPFKTWSDVRNASFLFKKKMGNRKITKGCPFIKVGHILSEIDVLCARDLDYSSKTQISVSKLQLESYQTAQQYIKNLSSRRRSQSTAQQVTLSIYYLEKWALKHDKKSIFALTSADVKNFALSLKKPTRDSHIGRLLNFFDWCCAHGFALDNHFFQFPRTGPPLELPICSDEQIKLLLKFIKNKETDSAQAMMISLSMFWGFRKIDLIYSTFSVEKSAFQIKTYQSQISYGHKYPTRQGVLNLPQRPRWFLDLQNRFIQDWKNRFEKLSWPDRRNLPLFPLKSGQYPRPMSRVMLTQEFNLATTKATGKAIPTKILRCTSGHLNADGGDASILSQIGWANTTAFTYTWLPRKHI